MTERICGSGEVAWTDARVARMKELAEAGLSFREIAADLQMTKGSVCGTAHRIGVKTKNPGPVKDHRSEPQPKAQRNGGAIMLSIKARAVQAKNLPTAEATRLPPEPHRDPAPLLSLKANSCRWPICDDADNTIGFCGTDRRDESVPYCAHHCRMAYRPFVPFSERLLDRLQIKRTVIAGQFV